MDKNPIIYWAYMSLEKLAFLGQHCNCFVISESEQKQSRRKRLDSCVEKLQHQEFDVTVL